jgi:hypothetical protein
VQHYLALGAGVVGVAGVTLGAILGLKAASKHDSADAHCDGAACRDLVGVDLRSDARSAGNWSTAGFVVGALGLGAGAVLWFTAGSPSSERTSVEVGIEHVALRGSL